MAMGEEGRNAALQVIILVRIRDGYSKGVFMQLLDRVLMLFFRFLPQVCFDLAYDIGALCFTLLPVLGGWDFVT